MMISRCPHVRPPHDRKSTSGEQGSATFGRPVLCDECTAICAGLSALGKLAHLFGGTLTDGIRSGIRDPGSDMTDEKNPAPGQEAFEAYVRDETPRPRWIDLSPDVRAKWCRVEETIAETEAIGHAKITDAARAASVLAAEEKIPPPLTEEELREIAAAITVREREADAYVLRADPVLQGAKRLLQEVRRLQEDLASERATVDRLRAERNAIADASVLGRIADDLDEDNAATDAKHVRAAIAELSRTRAEEREACARIADDAEREAAASSGPSPGTRAAVAATVAAKIRARGEKT